MGTLLLTAYGDIIKNAQHPAKERKSHAAAALKSVVARPWERKFPGFSLAEELSRYLRGWIDYFGKCETPSVLVCDLEAVETGSR